MQSVNRLGTSRLILALALILSGCAVDNPSTEGPSPIVRTDAPDYSPSRDAAVTQGADTRPTEAATSVAAQVRRGWVAARVLTGESAGVRTPSLQPVAQDKPLAELLPAVLNGEARVDQDLPDGACAAQVAREPDTGDAGCLVSTWGTGETAVSMLSTRMPTGAPWSLNALLETSDGDLITLGGKTVLATSAPELGSSTYTYIVNDVVFVVMSPSEGRAAELLAQLP